MKNGGKRAGAGRKSGAATVKTRDIADKAAVEGLTPLEYLLEVMRDQGETRPIRVDAAKAAAPFIHPRLANVDARIKNDLYIEVQQYCAIECNDDGGS